MKNIIIYIVGLFACVTLHAQETLTNNGNFKLYTGASVTFFGDVLNNGTIIDSGLLVTMAGSTSKNIAGTSITTFNNLTINNSSATGVTLGQTLNVRGALTLSTGLLNTTSTHILTMQNAATVAVGNSTSTSYVNGPMKYQKSTSGGSVLNFPIGKGPDCRPIALTVNHISISLFNYQTESFNASAEGLGYSLPATVDKVSKVHYATIIRTDSSGTAEPIANLSGNQTIQLFFGTNDTVVDGSTLTICKNTSATPTAWSDIGGAEAPAYSGGALLTGSISSTSSPSEFTSFSTFTLGNRTSGFNPLPIELLYFDAKKCDTKACVNLTWQTASELNSSHFILEKASDGIRFETIGRLEAAGYSNRLVSYSFTDENPFLGINHYRLNQFDNNWTHHYSPVRTVLFSNSVSVANVYPNPFNNELNFVTGDASQTINFQLRVYNELGKEVMSQVLIKQSTVINTCHLPSGVYYYQLTDPTGDSIQSGRLVSLQ